MDFGQIPYGTLRFFGPVRRRRLMLYCCGWLLGCSSAPQPATVATYDTDMRAVRVEARLHPSATSPLAVTGVNISVPSASTSATLSYSASAAAFSGSMLLPVGTHPITATAFDTGGGVAAQGATIASISEFQTTPVVITLLDATGAPAPVDLGPLITVFSLSTTTPAPGSPITAIVAATDPSGDAVAVAWSDTCSAGSFTQPGSEVTHWQNAVAELCAVRATVTAGGLTDSTFQVVQVQ